jgi:hypothetical protein
MCKIIFYCIVCIYIYKTNAAECLYTIYIYMCVCVCVCVCTQYSLHYDFTVYLMTHHLVHAFM